MVEIVISKQFEVIYVKFCIVKKLKIVDKSFKYLKVTKRFKVSETFEIVSK